MPSRTDLLRSTTPRHDLSTSNAPNTPHAEIHIDSSNYAHSQPQVTYFRNRFNLRALELHDTGLSDVGSSGHWATPVRSNNSTPQPPSRLQLEGYVVEGGWQPDGLGHYHRVEQATVAEVNEGGDVIPNSQESFHNMPLPGYLGNMKITDPLPSNTTPPPQPRRRGIDILPSATTSLRGIGARDALSSLNFSSPPLAGSQETDLLAMNLRSVDITVICVDSLSLLFTSVNHLFDIAPNVNSCERIKMSLMAVKTALNRRTRFSDDQWQKGSQRSHLNYKERLSSLARTLQKLCLFENYIKTRRTTLKMIQRSLQKLREYESKFSNIEQKLNALFDRIRVRHLHAKLSEAHTEAQRIRTSDYSNQESFQRRWTEGKTLRANLRSDYHAYRNGRRPSLVT